LPEPTGPRTQRMKLSSAWNAESVGLALYLIIDIL